MIVTSIFPAALKLTNITPAFEVVSKNSKKNNKPVSIFPNASKIYEGLLFNQINERGSK